MTGTYQRIKNTILHRSQWAWQILPLPTHVKLKFKNRVFLWLPFIFGRTQAYHRWQRFNENATAFHCPQPEDVSQQLHDMLVASETDSYVPLLDAQPLEHKPAKAICFYLPQFHAIPENNRWWGEGFTEWTNVRQARPCFAGHVQPHKPGELGYYDLLDPAVMRRQIELARLYGIEGFCFYFYWFGGKRLLEAPIKNFLETESLDFPFCLCWANENWSRRWDGLDSEILIAQKHSPEDDLAFIQYVSRYMADARYIRIKGRPLLMVYRPSLLPSAKKTAGRWRKWCRENGLGELFLAYTQSFEAVNPARYGFDAAIEFPPNNTAPPDITDQVKPFDDQFGGTVFDWRIFVERSRHYNKPSYTLFRGVCPSWDNTARRSNHGVVFQLNSPLEYQQWLYNAIEDTCNRFSDPDERLIFINAWNEWAESAYLEPDQRRGYAYLEATRMALVRSTLNLKPLQSDHKKPIAIVIHAFYPDVFEEILEYTKKIASITCRLYVTTTNDHLNHIRDCLLKQTHPFTLLPVENRGRDILPFLKIMPEVLKNDHDFLIKVHTKKSSHRQDGNLWRRDLFTQLIDERSIVESIKHLKDHPQIGVLGPNGHIVPMYYYCGSNALQLKGFSKRLGIDTLQLGTLKFVAGSMFIARLKTLLPLLNLSLPEDSFETGKWSG
jgi:lipopolysaccharide biosynthesis protein